MLSKMIDFRGEIMRIKTLQKLSNFIKKKKKQKFFFSFKSRFDEKKIPLDVENIYNFQ